MDMRIKRLRELSAAQFAKWELHLYLDTHPSDMTAAALYAQYEKRVAQLREMYEQDYGPLSTSSGEGAEWLKNPWPWETERCD